MAKILKGKRVLFFINGNVATDEEAAAAMELAAVGHDVAFRNARLISDGESLEAFDDVAGAEDVVPLAYAEAAAKKKAIVERDAFAAFDHDGDGKPGGSLKKTPKPPKPAKGGGKPDPARAGALDALTGGTAQEDPPKPLEAAQAGATDPAQPPAAGWGDPPADKPVDWKPNA